jgi:tetratricopeptide (TPR) repeat protein
MLHLEFLNKFCLIFIVVCCVTKSYGQLSADEQYPVLVSRYERGERDTVLLHRLALTAIKQNDQNMAAKVMGFIAAREVMPFVGPGMYPDWPAIQKKVVSKYGEVGKEVYYHERLLHAWLIAKDWVNMGRYYQLYFEKAITRSFGINVNNLSWYIFLYVDDNDVLEVAIKTMKYNLDMANGKAPDLIDTYASLLYKTGRRTEAIAWEEKALKLANKDKEFFAETLEKMKAGTLKWNGEITNNNSN